MNKTLKKVLFFYVIVHLLVLSTVVIGWFPSYESHSKTKEAMDLYFSMRRHEEKEIESKKQYFLNAVNRYLKDSVKLDMVVSESTTAAEWGKISPILKNWFDQHPTSDSFFNDYRLNILVNIAVKISNSNVQSEKTITINAPYKDQIKKWYLISSEQSQSQNGIWPFLKYREETFNEYSYTKTFYGVFSGYGVEEFFIYTLLPFFVIGLVYFYKRFVSN